MGVTGVAQAHTNLLYENTSSASQVPFRKSLHEYSDIKLNLYGVRNRSTKWLVQLVMLRDEYADFILGAGGNIEKRKINAKEVGRSPDGSPELGTDGSPTLGTGPHHPKGTVAE